tara:strand:+ start:3886 stop:7389 length:3504 start_codon:yes stop_codon:yes gene_type:complete
MQYWYNTLLSIPPSHSILHQTMVQLTRPVVVILFLLNVGISATRGDQFTDSIEPYLKKFCVTCHGSKDPKGGLNLTAYKSDKTVIANFRRWNNITTFIQSGEMPPKGSPQPEIEENNAVVNTVNSLLIKEARKHAGDPGNVPPRRLSNTEYDHSIRDLTGIDIRPTSDFPTDPAGGEGFDNTGEALTMSPNLLRKYLTAAQQVAEHMLLKTDGIAFAPTPAVSYNERRKLTELAIIDFYNQRTIEIREYVEAAWRFRYLSPQTGTSIRQYAEANGLSAKYLELVWNTLSKPNSSRGFTQQLEQYWKSVPPPLDNHGTPREFDELMRFIEFARNTLTPPLKGLIKSNAGNWPIHWLDFRAKTAAVRDKFSPEQLQSEVLVNVGRVPVFKEGTEPYSMSIEFRKGYSDDEGYVIIKRPLFSNAQALPKNEKDETENHKVISLKAALDQHNSDLSAKLKFGTHPVAKSTSAEAFDPEWLVIKTPALIEIPFTSEMHKELQGKHLLLQCQLDSQESRDASVFIQFGNGHPPQTKFDAKTTHLIYSDGKVAAEFIDSVHPFCNTFPNRFFYVDAKRGLAAGFHLVEGFFRDDKPLMEKVLTEQEIRQLDKLWKELDFVTNRTETLLRGFVWFERSERHVLHGREWDYLRAEDPALITEQLLGRFEIQYLEKMGTPSKPGTEEAQRRAVEAETPSEKFDMVHGFFEDVRTGLAEQRNVLAAAEPKGLNDVLQFATRAYKRPLSEDEMQGYNTLYQHLRAEGQTVEQSLRGLLTAILMAPDYIYRYNDTPTGRGIVPLNDRDLASRLSYFLWSSIPDDALLQSAQKQELSQGQHLQYHAERMMSDDRITALAREFFGQWLRYRDYLSKDPINAEAFPQYTETLRNAMWREPIELGVHIIRHDLPITTLINSDTTHVNGVLAKHYGGAIKTQWDRAISAAGKHLEVTQQKVLSREELESMWFEVDGIREQGRGGLFGMAVILAKNSSGERTSPVKRGFWTVHHLLGQHFPPPPADVPELPDNVNEGQHSLRQLLNAHVSDVSCAICHKHFDYLGMAQEGFDAIGQFRTKDSAGRAIDNAVILPDGQTAKGVDGIIKYIEGHRQREFVRTFCRKFLGYALGRSVELSDQPLLDEIELALSENNYRFSTLVTIIVASPQFRNQRAQDFVKATRRNGR